MILLLEVIRQTSSSSSHKEAEYSCLLLGFNLSLLELKIVLLFNAYYRADFLEKQLFIHRVFVSELLEYFQAFAKGLLRDSQ